MRKTLLMTTALVAIVGATNVWATPITGEQSQDFVVDVKNGESIEINGAYSVDSNQDVLWSNSVSVEKGGSLTLVDTNLKADTTGDNVTVKGTLTATNSILEAGNDNEETRTVGNMLLDGANADLSDSDLEATGNITIKDSDMTVVSSDTLEYGLYADGNIDVKGGNLNLTDTYLIAKGGVSIDGGTHILDTTYVFSETGSATIKNADLTVSTDYAEDYKYGINVDEGIDIKDTKLSMTNSYLEAIEDITIEGGEYNFVDTDTLSDGSVVVNNGTFTNQNSDFEAFDKVVINDGTFNFSQSSDFTGLNGVEINNGTVNFDDGEIWSLGDVNINGGTVNLENTSTINTVYENLDEIYEDENIVEPEVAGNINISNAEVNTNTSYIFTKGDISVDNASLMMENSNMVADGNITISNSSIEATYNEENAGDYVPMENINGEGIHGTHQSISSLGKVDISGDDTVITLNDTAINGYEEFNMTGGTVNLNSTSNDTVATIWSAGDINLSGGTINVQDGAINTFHNVDGVDSLGNITIDGATINVGEHLNIGSKGNMELVSGVINVAEDADLTVSNNYNADMTFNTDNLGTLKMAQDGTINLDGIFNGNIEGDGTVNVKNYYAMIDGSVDGINLNIETDNTLSELITGSAGTRTDLSSLNVKEGTFIVDSELAVEGSINISEGAGLTVDNTELSTKDNISLSGVNLTLNEATLSTNGDINVEGGEYALNDSEINAWDGNVNISGGEINLTGEGNKETGLYARKEFNVTGGTINMNGGDTIINNIADYKPNDYDHYDLNINGGTINVNAGFGEISSSKNVNIIGGTINIAEDATLGIYGGNDKAETTALVGSDAIFNINGTLDTNIKGNGTLNINSDSAKIGGNVNMTDGGIMNVGLNTATVDGDVVFASGSKLNLEVAEADSYGSVVANSITAEEGAKLGLTVSKNLSIGEKMTGLKLLDAQEVDNNFANELSNARYTVTNDAGTYTIEYVATSSDVVEDEGGSSTNASTGEAWDSIVSSDVANEVTKAVSDALNELSQHDPKAYVDALKAIAPEVAPVIQQTAKETINQIFGAVGSRLTGGSVSTGGRGVSAGGGHGMHGNRGHGGNGYRGGRGHGGHRGKSSGDSLFERFAVWMQGMFNKAELEDTAKSSGFDSETSGVAFGVEKFVSNNTKVGVGYAYNNTEIDGFMRNTDVDTHTAILYGEYKPSQWYVNTVATYGWSDYSEQKNVAGVNVNADYDAETFGLQAMTGYEMNVNGVGITPEAGLRYVHIKQDAYKDSSEQKVSGNDSDIVTAVVGAKVNKTFELENGAYITPEAKIAATYDIVNDDTNSIVTLANGSAYNVEGESLDEFGLEVGLGVTAELNANIELSVGYEGKFKEDYQDHTGMLNAKYKF